jgi:adenylate kinase
MGPQGSGKGTQAEKLSETFSIPAFGMGQLLREEIARESELGIKFQDIIKRGELVSDEDAAAMLKLRLAKPDTENGYLLDGYPRNTQQYDAFNFDTPTHVIVIEIPREESLKRLGGRLTCGACNRVGSINDGLKAGDPCDCGGEWYQREDDTPEAIERRLQIFENDTAPVIESYGDIVTSVDGMGTINEVFERITSVLK